MILESRGLNVSLGRWTELYWKMCLQIGNIHGRSQNIQIDTTSSGQSHIAEVKFFAAVIIALLEYVSCSQKSLEHFLVQHWGIHSNLWDVLHGANWLESRQNAEERPTYLDDFSPLGDAKNALNFDDLPSIFASPIQCVSVAQSRAWVKAASLEAA